MSAGEFDSPSKPASEEYRANWERIWGRLWSDPGLYPLTQEDIEQCRTTYANGCPVLSDE